MAQRMHRCVRVVRRKSTGGVCPAAMCLAHTWPTMVAIAVGLEASGQPRNGQAIVSPGGPGDSAGVTGVHIVRGRRGGEINGDAIWLGVAEGGVAGVGAN